MDANQRRRNGKALRARLPRSSHGAWSAAADRPDPVELIEAQNADRVDWLLPVRRARMSESPFAFYRGAVRLMAADLGAAPHSGLPVQLCGDAHLANFGVYASPERDLVFDVDDFDETLPGPFEWDVKRLGASFTIAGQHRGFDPAICRSLAEEVTRSYRATMQSLAEKGWIAAWHSGVSFTELLRLAEAEGSSKKRVKRGKEFAAKAKSKDRLSAASKLVEEHRGEYRFRSEPPLLVPLREMPFSVYPDEFRAAVHSSYRDYRKSLPTNVRWLLDRYRVVDLALKVVGVGSVGTRCFAMVLIGDGDHDVLLLQIKEATNSVLEEHLPASRYRLHGRRVVEGQRLMQASSDVFLGWSRSVFGHDFYWRQLKDWKASADLDFGSPKRFGRYARLCGSTLARGHAVSGDPVAIAGYLGSGDVFDRAIGAFAVRYAEQNNNDYRAFTAAIDAGRLEARVDVLPT